MSELDTRQISAILVRVEKKLDRMEAQAIHRAEIQALEKDVAALQDAQKWLTRTAVGALVLAVLDPVLRVFTG
ncbi:hemolysin XhlA family protein [Rothia sp. L_38]|uniref:hemolysin XhlA family protein n=1 Tax=Rothia sp. L_38 TaxID=3422315 RepID=UPI003D6C12EC